MSLELPRHLADQVRELAAIRRTSVVQVILQAIVDEKFFREQVREGKNILLQNADGTFNMINLPE